MSKSRQRRRWLAWERYRAHYGPGAITHRAHWQWWYKRLRVTHGRAWVARSWFD